VARTPRVRRARARRRGTAAGPRYGLLYAAVHPALALCFVVPFLPLSLDDDGGGGGDDDDASVASSDVGAHRSPLHDFEPASVRKPTTGPAHATLQLVWSSLEFGVVLDHLGSRSRRGPGPVSVAASDPIS